MKKEINGLFERFDFETYIESLVEKAESFDMEYKSAAGGFPGSFWDTYSAFANTQGGTIVLGVKERDDSFIIEGLSNEQITKYKKDFWNSVNNKSTVNVNLLKEEDVQVGEYQGCTLMTFRIPRAGRTQRPVYRTTIPYNGTFKRNNEGDYKCTEQEVQRMFADADDSRPRDGRILTGFTMDDIDLDTVKQYRQLFNTSKPGHPWLTLDDLSLLKKLGGYRVDRESGKEGFTLAGLLMFGKMESINDPECAPNYFPDYRESLSEDPNIRWTDRIYPDGTWEANLFQFYKKVLPRLTSVLPKPFRLENNIRIDEAPTHVAIREAFINSLIHADYSVNASIVMEHKVDRFIFSNPGNMLISRAQYYDGGESVCRNKSLQQMFMLIGSAEKAGSGVDKILSGWREANWQKPYVDEKANPDKVVLLLTMESLLPQDVKEELIQVFGKEIESIGYEKLAVLSIACTEGEVTNDRLKFVVDMHSADISKLLKELCGLGYLVSKGNGRGTKYYLLDESIATSPESIATSPESIATSPESIATYRVTKNYYKKEVLEAKIIEICADFTDLEEIALIIGRNIRYLNNYIIPGMIKTGKLERLFSVKNHPNQKYKAK